MRLLLDSHALLWALADERKLASGARAALQDGANSVAASPASVWEVAIKRAAGKLGVPDAFLEALAAARFDPLPITIQHAWAAGALPPHHSDPFDRMLVAQAQLERLTIVTRDPRISKYDVRVMAA